MMEYMHFGFTQCKQKGPALSERSESKGSVQLLLVLVIVVLLLIGGGIYLFQSNQKNAPVAVIQSNYNNYKNYNNYDNYSNQTLSFEFQYPLKDFAVKQDSEEEFNKRGNGDFRKNFKGYVGYEPAQVMGAVAVLDQSNDFEKSPLTVWVFNNENNLTIDAWFNNYWYYPYLWGVFDYISKGHIALDTEATISGQPAKSKIITYQPGMPKFVYAANNGRMYLFRVIGEAGEKILETFQLLTLDSTNCKVTGCSGQICSDKDVVTTCEMLSQYGCYKNAKCERQSDGQCGWTMTKELKECLGKN